MGNEIGNKKDDLNPSSNKYACNESELEGTYYYLCETIQRLYDFWDLPEIIKIVNHYPTNKTSLPLSTIPLISSFFSDFGVLWKETKLQFNQQICERILLFHSDYNDFQMSVSQNIRNEKGKRISKLYINSNGDRKLNLSKQCKNVFRQIIIKNNYQYQKDSFDMVLIEILYQIKYKIWPGLINATNQNIRVLKKISINGCNGLENQIVIKSMSENELSKCPQFADIVLPHQINK